MQKISSLAGPAESNKSLDKINNSRYRSSPSSESIYTLRLKEWSRQIPPSRLSREWENCILDLIPLRLKKLHPRCLEKILLEVRDIYENEMINCAIESIVGTDYSTEHNTDCQLSNQLFDHCFDFCPRYNVPRQRQSFANKYFLSHNIMRRIIEIASLKLDRVIVDLDHIVENNNRNNLFDLSSLGDTMMSNVTRVATMIKNDYYPEIVRIIAATIRNSNGKSNRIEKNHAIGKGSETTTETIKLLRCATNLFVQQIVNIMIKTIDELTDRLANYRLQCPRLNLRLVWKNEDKSLSIDPPISEIYSMWHSLVESIGNIADDLTTFEQLAATRAADYHPDRMKVTLPDWYVIESNRKIDEALTKAVGPLERYFSNIAEEFEPVTSSETRLGIRELVSMSEQPGIEARKTNVDYSSSVKLLNQQKDRANEITDNLDLFDIGELDQSQARIRLIDEIADTRKSLVDGMLLSHEEYNEKICQDFRELSDKLLDIPTSARELFKLSETIAYPTMSLLLQGFESRVTRSIEMLSSLLAVTSDMTEKHTILNGITIKWLVDIKPIIARSNTLCEAMKSELEDELQRRIVRLNLEIEAVLPKFEILDRMDDATRVEDYSSHISLLVGHLNELDRRIVEINHEESLFKFPQTKFSSVEEIRDIIVPVSSLNNLAMEWRRDHDVWLNGPFEYIDAKVVREKTINHYRDEFERLNGTLRSRIKNDMQQSSSSSAGTSATSTKRFKLYTGIVDDPDPMQQPAPLTLCSRVIEEVKKFESHLELIDCVCNPSLRERHWQEISLIYEQSRKNSLRNGERASSSSSSFAADTSKIQDLLVSGQPQISAPDAGTTLAKLIRLDLAKDIEKYRVISIGANKELALANRLNEMIARWDTVDFSIVASADSPSARTFLRLDEIDTLMEEQEVITGEMKVSYFVKPIVAKLAKFSHSLESVSLIVKTWLRINGEWHDLEMVFRRKTRVENLARARDLFFSVSTDVISVVEERIMNKPRFRAIADESSELSELLSYAEATLESVRESVENYVQRVRNLFPRFYFISVREVIDIIFETKYSKKMRLLVRKCFTDIRGVRCWSAASAKDNNDDDDDRNNRVTSIFDSCGREFSLIHGSKDDARNDSAPDDYGSLVNSFVVIDRAIVRTIRDGISECCRSLYDRDEELAEGQVLSTLTDCTIELAGVCSWRLYWTSEMERALEHLEAGPSWASLSLHEVKQSSMIETMLAELRGGEISRIRRRTLVLLMIQVLEQRDITRLMMGKVMKRGGRFVRREFAWMAQIRHYWREKNVRVAILDTEECYGYEYSCFNKGEPVVRTPLTERCYHSLMEAHRNRLYGLVFGPGATGKTRSIQDLAQTLGIDLRIFDCAQHHLDDYRYMDNVFRGLVGRSSSSFCSSCWLLFKNLDLITIQGLSVLAQRVTSLSSINENRCFVIGTIRIQLGSSSASSRCRDSLPDTLKVLFRPIAFAFPDTKRIVEVLLFSEGFSRAAILAEKLRLYEKYSSQSSSYNQSTVSCDLYHSGMRTIKSVVKTACALKIRYPNETEDALFLRALVDVHLPKFTSPSDLTNFQHTMDDLFPNVSLPPPKYEHLLSAIRRVMREIKPPTDDRDPFLIIILKIIQLFEMLLVRHAVIVVGSSFSGKTTVIDTLARSLSLLDDDDASAPAPSIHSIRINHNSFNNEELFGNYDNEYSGKLFWNDGIFTRALRSFVDTDKREAEKKKKHWQWLVLDGPLRTPFIDKLTTLLDENDKTLFLRSGEKIRLNDSTSVIFETSSTIRATPAMIARCGIVYIEESSTIDWKIRIGRWILEHQRNYHDLVPRRSSSSTELRDNQARDTSDGDEYAKFLQSLLERSLGPCLEFLQQHTEKTRKGGGLPINKNHMVISVLRLLEMYLNDALGRDEHHHQQIHSSKDSSVLSSSDRRYNPENKEEEEKDTVKNSEENERAKSYISNFFSWSQAAVLMSIVWGLGGSLDRNSGASFDEFCRSMWRIDAKFPYEVIGLPSEGLIRDNIYVFAVGASGSGCWRQWSDVLKREYSGSDVIDYFWSSKAGPTSYVPNVDSIRYISLFQTHVKYRKPFIVSGKTATGKTLYMRHLLKTKIEPKQHQSNFHIPPADSSLRGSSSPSVQNMFLSRMKKISKRVYRPSEEARVCINFVDDMNVVTVSKNEAILRELIRQYYENSHDDGCWYDIDSGDRIRLEDAMFLGAIDSGANRYESGQDDRVTGEWDEAARFFRHFNIYTIDGPSDESIFRIYFNILLANLRNNMFNADVVGSVTSIVNATIEVYSSIVHKLRPVPTKLQYHFSLRDASRLIDGCSLIHKESAETKVTLMRLWVHETIRIFSDRIVDQTDADWLFAKIRESAATHFKDSWETVFDNLPKNSGKKATEQLTRESFRHLIFSDFMRIPEMPLDKDGKRMSNANGVANIVNDNATKQHQRYEEITCSREALKNRAILYLERYNDRFNDAKKLDILIFPEMLEHLMRICRILEIPGASLLIMCFGGSSGRRSLTALAAHIKSQRLEELSCSVIESMMTPNSPVGTWRRDFKRACMNCISPVISDDSVASTDLHIRDCMFFISDREIIGSPSCRSFLDDICSLMKTGRATAPSFFTIDERDDIVERCRLLAQRGDRNRELNSHEVMDYFYSKCQDKLHFVLYFDRSGMTRRRGGQQLDDGIFAKILNHCSVDCYENWPEEAVHEIGNKFMRDIDIESRVKSGAIVASKYFWDSVVITDGSINEAMNNCRSTATSTRRRGLPVSAYIHTVKLYGLSINKRQRETRASRERYLSGLDKLKLADEEVRKMRSTLTRLRPELELSADETAETMRKIERENISVEMATIQVKREEEIANGIAEVAGILKEECEADLAVAIPILEDAIAALNTLKPTDITLVKAMKNPPDTVKLVLAAVCVMLGVSPDRSIDPVTGKKSIDYWAPSKRILGDMNFLQNLKDYDKDNIPATVMIVVNKSYMNDESFMPHIVAKASSAAEGLCKWVRAMVSYDEVAKVVAPKKEKLATAERECNASLEYLNEKRTSLAALNDRLAALNASLRATLAKKLQLENEVASCTGKMKRAEALIASLAGEKARWLETAENLTSTCDNLAGDVLLSCGLVALLSSLSAKQRNFYIDDWRKELDRLAIPNSGESYEFLGSLRTSEIRYPLNNTTSDDSWHHHHHHHNNHRLSVDSPFNRANASILHHTLLWPLILDPQNQANMWIKRVESSNGLVVVKPTNPRWFNEIRDCMEKNLPVLLENLDRPVYLERTPLILRYFGTSSSSTSFRLYMTTRISFNEASLTRRLLEPHDMYKRFSVVNFTLANDALEDSLLEIIVSREKPELRDTFDRLMITSAANRRLLAREEEKILEVLSGTSVNIIEDERAIERLDRWKNLSLEMRMREVETAKATEREMNELRTIYRPLTKYCAALYDTLANLVNFNHMYRFSLDWFVRLYVRSIDTSMRSVVLDKRLNYLGSSFTLTLDASVRNSLLDEHKLLYSFLLSIEILLDTRKIQRHELRTLFLADPVDGKCDEDPSFFSESAARTSPMEIRNSKFNIAQQLGNALPDIFQNLSTSFQQDSSSWESYWNDNNDETPLPLPWNSELTDFQRLILVNRLRPEKTLIEVLRLVENTLGSNSIGTTSSSTSTVMHDNTMSRSFDESSCVVPLIFVLPSYLEPFVLIKKCAKKIGYSSKVLRFSMPPSSSSEYSEFEDKIELARRHGGWIILENCHLATDEWLAKLEEISESLDDNDNKTVTSLSFRLWLTSYPSENFPISILHDGTKIHCEQPDDRIKRSLLNFYANKPLDDPDFYNTRSDGNNARAFSKLVYAICFFHAIVAGRNCFYELAWNVSSYEFTDSDLKISIGHLRRVFMDVPNESFTIGELYDSRNNEREDECQENLIDTMVYLVGDCYYGGRILDPYDRNCLRAILRDCCNSRVVRSITNYTLAGGTLSSFPNDVQEYSIPNRSEYRDFVRYTRDCLPNGKTPAQLFGLDDNAAIVRDCHNSRYFVKSLARSLAYMDEDARASRDEPKNPKLLEIVRIIRTKLLIKDGTSVPKDGSDIKVLGNVDPVIYEEPLNSILIEQVESYEKMIEIIGSSLVNVDETGTYVSEQHDELIESLTRNRVPKDWSMMIGGFDTTSDIDDCSSLSSFIDSLSNRREFLNNWTKFGHYAGSIWLGGLIMCRKFVLAARLTLSRKSGILLDHLVMDYEITRIATNYVKPWEFIAVNADDAINVIHVHGLYLSGARWDIKRSSLVESLPKLYMNTMPMIRLRSRCLELPTIAKNVRKTNYYTCPVNSSPAGKKNVYFLSTLSYNYVTTVPLESKDATSEHWIKRRTVMFCKK